MFCFCLFILTYINLDYIHFEKRANKTPPKICLAHININSIRNKLDSLLEVTYGFVDFLAVSETKLNSSFPTEQFNLPKFRTPYRKGVSGKSEGLLVYVNSNISYKVLKVPDCSSDIQVIPVEINLMKQKWLVVAIYNATISV